MVFARDGFHVEPQTVVSPTRIGFTCFQRARDAIFRYSRNSALTAQYFIIRFSLCVCVDGIACVLANSLYTYVCVCVSVHAHDRSTESFTRAPRVVTKTTTSTTTTSTSALILIIIIRNNTSSRRRARRSDAISSRSSSACFRRPESHRHAPPLLGPARPTGVALCSVSFEIASRPCPPARACDPTPDRTTVFPATFTTLYYNTIVAWLRLRLLPTVQNRWSACLRERNRGRRFLHKNGEIQKKKKKTLTLVKVVSNSIEIWKID